MHDDEKTEIELTGPIVWKQEAQRLAFGAVLVPGEPDSDGDLLTAEKVAEVAHEWLAQYGNIDLQHTLNNAAVPVESYVLAADMEVTLKGEKATLPKGTWILGSRIADDHLWAQVTKGKLTGYSVMGVRRAALKSQDAAIAYKRTMLADLGEDWIAPFVSLVDEPAVPKAKFFALKHKTEAGATEGASFVRRLFGVRKQQQQEQDMDKQEIGSMIDEAVKAALGGVQETVTGLGQKIDEIGAAVEKSKADDETAALKTALDEQKKSVDELREVVEKSAEAVAKLAAVKSRALPLDAGDASTKSEEFKRDAFGRRVA